MSGFVRFGSTDGAYSNHPLNLALTARPTFQMASPAVLPVRHLAPYRFSLTKVV